TAGFGSSTNFQASQGNIFNQSGVTGSGTSYGQSLGPYSGTNAGNSVGIIATGAGSVGSSNNYGSSTGLGVIGAGTNFNGYDNATPYH
ncbi:hypothetical protein K502DRAFT_353585, partial [Neoconidiobolus thromboides FSU 785]